MEHKPRTSVEILSKMAAVKETGNFREANSNIEDGWILLHIFSCTWMDSQETTMRYVLGWPHELGPVPMSAV